MIPDSPRATTLVSFGYAATSAANVAGWVSDSVALLASVLTVVWMVMQITKDSRVKTAWRWLVAKFKKEHDNVDI